MPDWTKVKLMNCLGHFISADGSLDAPFNAVRCSLWRGFFAKFKRSKLRFLEDDQIADEVNRHLTPVVAYRFPAWPFQKTLASKLDQLQAKIIAAASAIEVLPDEDQTEFRKRRMRVAHALAEVSGKWSLRWASAVVTWDAHIARNTCGLLWAAALRKVRDARYLQDRRRSFLPKFSVRAGGWSELAGRTDTRATRGSVSIRFHDGLLAATERLQEARLKERLKSKESTHSRKACN
jgi:hypothetical protein